MMAIDAIVLDNPRLGFRDSHRPVHDFIRRRLSHFGCGRIHICRDREAAQSVVDEYASAGFSGHVVVLDGMNPITDWALVEAMASRTDAYGCPACVQDGAIPGTEVMCVLKFPEARGYRLEALGSPEWPALRQRWFAQDGQNNQFNLYKYKRLKMFLGLNTALPELYRLGIPEVVDALAREPVFSDVATFFSGGRTVAYDACPHCEGRLTPLPLRMSQPFCGYLPATRPVYHECDACGLILLSPAPADDSIPALYDDFDKQDFVVSHNNPYHTGAPRCDFSAFERLLPERARTLDLGGGMGKFSEFLKAEHPQWDVTHADFEIKRNPRLEELGIRTRALNFIAEPMGEQCYDLITAWEVVEHVPFHHFNEVLNNVYRALAPGGMFVFSTPDFDSPLCRAFDFFGVCSPFHYLVFSESWLRRYFAAIPEWEYFAPRACSDFLDDAKMWFEYASRTAPTFQVRALSRVLQEIFTSGQGGAVKSELLGRGIGTEVIITLRKRVQATAEDRDECQYARSA